MNTDKLDHTFLERLKESLLELSSNETWEILGADDTTNRENFLWKSCKDDVAIHINESLVNYWLLNLPHALYIVLEDRWRHLDIDFQAITGKESYSKPDPRSFQSYTLYVCDRHPCFERGDIELGMRHLTMKWCLIAKTNTFGLEDIYFHVLVPFLEDPARLPLLQQVMAVASTVLYRNGQA